MTVDHAGGDEGGGKRGKGGSVHKQGSLGKIPEGGTKVRESGLWVSTCEEGEKFDRASYLNGAGA